MRPSVVVIGSGIVGTSICCGLSKYDVDIVLLEKEADIAFGGATKANTAILHAGYDEKIGTLAARLCSKGNDLWREIASSLSIPLRITGSLVVALENEEVAVLEDLMVRGEKNGITGLKIIDSREIREMEPNLSKKSLAALYAPTAGIICPYEAAIALAENMKVNGGRILLNTKITGIIRKNGRIEGAQTNKGNVKADFIINAGGLYADEISFLAGIDDFKITPRKGEYLIYDKEIGNLVNHPIFPVPTQTSKGIMVSPTIGGNILAGPNAKETWDKEDLTTTSSGLREVLNGAFRLLPRLKDYQDAVISGFAGLRAISSTGDFLIKSYDELYGFINVAGIKSPGLTSAPAIAEMVVDILKEAGLDLAEKQDFMFFRDPLPHYIRNLSIDNAGKSTFEGCECGKIVCRCEDVTEAEVIEAVRRGASNIDGVKYRTRAGMGRCQGGFCTPHIIRILSKEMRVQAQNVTKKGDGSNIVFGHAKALLTDDEDD